VVTPNQGVDQVVIHWGLQSTLNNWSDAETYDFENGNPPVPLQSHSALNFIGSPYPSSSIPFIAQTDLGISETYFFVGALPTGADSETEGLKVQYITGRADQRIPLVNVDRAAKKHFQKNPVFGNDLFLGMQLKSTRETIGNIRIFADGSSTAINFWRTFNGPPPRYLMNSGCFLMQYESVFSVGISPNLVYWSNDFVTLAIPGFYSQYLDVNLTQCLVNVVIVDSDGIFALNATIVPNEVLKEIPLCTAGNEPFYWPFVGSSAVALVVLSFSIIVVGRLMNRIRKLKGNQYSIIK